MIKHFEDKKNGRVYAIAEGCKLDAIKKIIKRNPYLTDLNDSLEVFIDMESGEVSQKFGYGLSKALMPNKFVAVAKCHPDDEYDFEKGRDIADAKLMEKFNKSESAAIARWCKHQTHILNVIQGIED